MYRDDRNIKKSIKNDKNTSQYKKHIKLDYKICNKIIIKYVRINIVMKKNELKTNQINNFIRVLFFL